jgi:hypothetical protein
MLGYLGWFYTQSGCCTGPKSLTLSQAMLWTLTPLLSSDAAKDSRETPAVSRPLVPAAKKTWWDSSDLTRFSVGGIRMTFLWNLDSNLKRFHHTEKWSWVKQCQTACLFPRDPLMIWCLLDPLCSACS